jgi:DNA-binding CsgD family transcriptional regulator
MLRFALSRLETDRVTVLLTARGDAPAWLPRAVREPRLRTIALSAFSLGALHELLRTRLDVALPRPALLRIWETSGGNPFFALELASALERRGGKIDPGAELPIPANLEELVHERLDRLGVDGLEVARVVAALASPTVGLVETAVGNRAEAGLAGALELRIVEVDANRLRFTHPLLRSAVSRRSTPANQRSLHARLASVVPGKEERARHLALATPTPSREVAAIVEQAAESVHARGAAPAAAELAELAVRLTPIEDADDLRRRVLDCADRHHEAGDGHRAIAQLEEACALAPPGAARAAVLVRLARTVREVVGPREAIGLSREALAEAEGDDTLEAMIHLSLAEAIADAEDGHRGLEHAELAVAAAARAGDITLRCSALATYGFLHFREGRGVPGTEMAEALALERSLLLWPRGAPATSVLALQLVWSCELGRARPVIDEWRTALSYLQDPEEERALWLLAILEWRAGNWDLGARHAADSLALRAQFGREGSQPIAELPAAMIAAHQGRIDEARERSERALSLAKVDGVRIAQSGHRCVLGFIELSRGDAAAALGYLERGWEIRDRVRLLEPGWRLELADTLEALIEVGRLDDAEQKLIPWEVRSRALDRAWALAITARCRALLLGARGDFAGAEVSFEHALHEHARTTDPFQHARTLLALGVTQRRAKKRGAARQTLGDALAVFEQLGAPMWAEKARDELKRIGGRAPSRGELTEAERRVAALVAEGRSNREVAAVLFITEHTVEAALTRAYRKLGVHSRAELTRQLNRKL